MTAWFISDIHIKDINERSSIILLRFLHSILEKNQPATHLFLLGDIFDLWVSDAPVFIQKFQALIDVIAQIKRSGVEVIYFEGNHDVYVKHFWQEKLNIPTYVESKTFDLGPYKVRLEHGDLINTEDVNYLKYRQIIRSAKMEKIAPIISGRILDLVGTIASGISRKISSKERENNQEKLRQMIRKYAERAYFETPFDFLITGHMHIQDDYSFQVGKNKNPRSINLGSWFDGAKAFRINDSGAEFINLN